MCGPQYNKSRSGALSCEDFRCAMADLGALVRSLLFSPTWYFYPQHVPTPCSTHAELLQTGALKQHLTALGQCKIRTGCDIPPHARPNCRMAALVAL